MVETGQNRTELGKLILAACFVTDFGTVLALGVVFANFNGWLALFVAITALVLWYLPRLTRFVIASVGQRVSEPELKFVFLVLFLLGGLAQVAKSEAVLPAYLVGLVIAGVFVRDKTLLDRMRAIAFTILTPFYFIKAGLLVSAPAVIAGAGLIVAFLAVKMLAKYASIGRCTRWISGAHGGTAGYDAADVDRAYVWHDFRAVRSQQSHHHAGSVHYPRDGRHRQRRRADAHRAALLRA